MESQIVDHSTRRKGVSSALQDSVEGALGLGKVSVHLDGAEECSYMCLFFSFFEPSKHCG